MLARDHRDRVRVEVGEEWQRTVSVVAEIEQLVAPLRHDPQSVLEEGDDDEEPADRGKVPATREEGKRQLQEDPIGTGHGPAGQDLAIETAAYGLMGSDKVSSMSSILEVCCRIMSSGFESALSSDDWPPNGAWPPSPYPDGPLAVAIAKIVEGADVDSYGGGGG
jgi:hypothetical protein